jgi:hypothetical protein
MYSEIMNKKCIVRSYDAGVYYGTVTAVDGETVKVENVRNIWGWEGANCLADVAFKGIRDGKVSRVVSSMVLNGCCQIIPCTDDAIRNLDNIRVWSY